MRLTPKNWQKFQHYKDRSPPWIKLHREILDDREFMLLPIASKALAPLLWLLASESADGTFDASDAELIFRLRVTQKDLTGLRPLIDKGFFTVASGALAERKQVARPEGEGEAEGKLKALSAKADDYPQGFQKFWKSYPNTKRKGGRPECFKVWSRRKLEASADAIVAHVTAMAASGDWQKNGGEFVPAPATYLNQARWDGADLNAQSPGEKPWFMSSWQTIVAKGKEFGLKEADYPTPPEFRSAVLVAAGVTPEMIKQAEADWK